MALVIVDKILFDGTPAAVYAAIDQYFDPSYGRVTTLRMKRHNKLLAAEDARIILAILDGRALALGLDVTLIGGHRSRVTVSTGELDDWPTYSPVWAELRAYIAAAMGGVAEAPQAPAVSPTGRQGKYSPANWREIFERIERTGNKPDFENLSREYGLSVKYIRAKWERFNNGTL